MTSSSDQQLLRFFKVLAIMKGLTVHTHVQYSSSKLSICMHNRAHPIWVP